MGKQASIPINNKEKPEPCRFQLIYEKVLGIGTWLLVLCHMLLTLSRYLFDYYTIARPIESRYALGLIGAALLYLLLCLILWPKTLCRVGGFLKKLCSPAQIFCILLFIWYIIICYIDTKYFSVPLFAGNDWWLLHTFITCVLLFSLPHVLPEEKGKKWIDILLHITALFGTFIAAYSLWNLFNLKLVTLPTGDQIGMDRQYRFYLGCHYNISAAIELSLVLICIYMLVTQKWPLKILYFAAMLCNTYVLMLNNSRAAFVACLAAYAVAGFLILWNLLRKIPVLLRLLIGIAAASGLVGLLWIARPEAFNLFENVTQFSKHLAAADGTPFRKAEILSKPAVWNGNGAGLLKMAGDKGDIVVRKLTDPMRREDVWKSAVNAMKSNRQIMLFGVTPVGVSETLRAIGGLKTDVAHAHNEVLQMGVAMGAPAMVLFTLFLIYIIVISIRLGMAEGVHHFRGAWILPVVPAGLIVLTLVEAYLFGYFSIMSCLFFLFCGWINSLTVKRKGKKAGSPESMDH